MNGIGAAGRAPAEPVLVLLPVIEIGGHPAVFVDIEKREFYLFGSSFNVSVQPTASFPAGC